MWLPRFIRAVFAWERVELAGPVWSYWQNGVTGERMARREWSDGYQPLHWAWLEAAHRWRVVDNGHVTKGGRL